MNWLHSQGSYSDERIGFPDALLRVNTGRWLLALLNLFQLDTNDGKPGDIEGVAQRLRILIPLAHVAVSIVDPNRPDLFACLFERHDNVRAIHSFSRRLKQIPELVAKR